MPGTASGAGRGGDGAVGGWVRLTTAAQATSGSPSSRTLVAQSVAAESPPVEHTSPVGPRRRSENLVLRDQGANRLGVLAIQLGEADADARRRVLAALAAHPADLAHGVYRLGASR